MPPSPPLSAIRSPSPPLQASPLPEYFPAGTDACAHAFFADAGWHLYVAAVVGAGDAATLVMARYTAVTGTEPYEPFWSLLGRVPLSALGVGGGVGTPSCVATASTLWVQLQGGLAGCALDGSGTCARALPIAPGAALSALQWSTSAHMVYGLLRNNSTADSAAVVSFVDDGAGTPSLVVVAAPVPAPSRAGLAALMSDRRGAHARA